jgi:hypothetical protein
LPYLLRVLASPTHRWSIGLQFASTAAFVFVLATLDIDSERAYLTIDCAVDGQHLGRIAAVDRWASAIVPAASAALGGLQAAASHAFALLYPSVVGNVTANGSWPAAGVAAGAVASLLAASPQQQAWLAGMRTPMRTHSSPLAASGAQDTGAASEYFFVEPQALHSLRLADPDRHCWHLPGVYVHLTAALVTLLSLGRWYLVGNNRPLQPPDAWLTPAPGAASGQRGREIAAAALASAAPGAERLLRQVRPVAMGAITDAVRAAVVLAPVLFVGGELLAGSARLLLSVVPVFVCAALAAGAGSGGRAAAWLAATSAAQHTANALKSMLAAAAGLAPTASAAAELSLAYPAAAAFLAAARAVLHLASQLSLVLLSRPLSIAAAASAAVVRALLPSILAAPSVSLPLLLLSWLPMLLLAWLVALPTALAVGLSVAYMAAVEGALIGVMATRRLRLADVLAGVPSLMRRVAGPLLATGGTSLPAPAAEAGAGRMGARLADRRGPSASERATSPADTLRLRLAAMALSVERPGSVAAYLLAYPVPPPATLFDLGAVPAALPGRGSGPGQALSGAGAGPAFVWGSSRGAAARRQGVADAAFAPAAVPTVSSADPASGLAAFAGAGVLYQPPPWRLLSLFHAELGRTVEAGERARRSKGLPATGPLRAAGGAASAGWLPSASLLRWVWQLFSTPATALLHVLMPGDPGADAAGPHSLAGGTGAAPACPPASPQDVSAAIDRLAAFLRDRPFLAAPEPFSTAQPLAGQSPRETAVLAAWQRRLAAAEFALHCGDAAVCGSAGAALPGFLAPAALYPTLPGAPVPPALPLPLSVVPAAAGDPDVESGAGLRNCLLASLGRATRAQQQFLLLAAQLAARGVPCGYTAAGARPRDQPLALWSAQCDGSSTALSAPVGSPLRLVADAIARAAFSPAGCRITIFPSVQLRYALRRPGEGNGDAYKTDVAAQAAAVSCSSAVLDASPRPTDSRQGFAFSVAAVDFLMLARHAEPRR